MADHPSYAELRSGLPLTGESGAIFNRLLAMLGRRREEFLVHSIVSCVPPAGPKGQGAWLSGAPYEASAINHCRTHLDRTLAQAGPVVVALGDLAMRTLLDIPRLPKGTMTEFHGHVIREPHGRFWVVPTFEPRFLQRGGQNLMGVVLRDLQRALDVARSGFDPAEPDLIEDPSVEWFDAWATAYLEAVRADPSGIWLAVDIETPHGIKGNDLPTWKIERINFSAHPDEGVTVPWTGAYIDIARRLLASPGVKIFWNWRFDVRRLEHNDSPVAGRIWDALDFWHAYQSDMGGSDEDKGGAGGAKVKGNSLGFVAPVYSGAAPWKHLSDSRPSFYAAKDAAQTFRIAAGVVADLTRDGMLRVATVHLSLFDQFVMSPAEKVGLGVDLARLPAFTEDLKAKEVVLLAEIEALAPPEVGGLHPGPGWASPPDTTRLAGAPADGVSNGPYPGDENGFSTTQGVRVATTLVKGIERTAPLVNRPEISKVKKCFACGACARVTSKHRCKERYVNKKGVEKERVSKTLTPDVREIEELTDRWYIRLPFNPGSSQQMKAVFRAWSLPLSKGDKADKLALDAAYKKCGPKQLDRKLFFKCCLAWRKIAKIEGTYGTGTLKRIAAQEARGVMDGRLHPYFSNKPSTLRTSCKGPNLQNVVSR